MLKRLLSLTIVALGFTLISIVSFADDAPAGAPHPMIPPKAAVDACSGKSKGDPCGFTTPTGIKISGQCFQHPGPDNSNKPAFCMPPHHGIMWKHPKTDEPGGSGAQAPAGAQPPAGGDAPANPGSGAAPKDVD